MYQEKSKILLFITCNCDDGWKWTFNQHLVMGVNNLKAEEWYDSFGKVYKTMIDEGLESIMVGHIALSEMSRKLRLGIKDEEHQRYMKRVYQVKKRSA